MRPPTEYLLQFHLMLSRTEVLLHDWQILPGFLGHGSLPSAIPASASCWTYRLLNAEGISLAFGVIPMPTLSDGEACEQGCLWFPDKADVTLQVPFYTQAMLLIIRYGETLLLQCPFRDLLKDVPVPVTVTPLATPTDSTHALTVAFIPRGFTASELGLYAVTCDAMTDGLRTIEPFKRRWPQLSIVRVDAPAAVSGTAPDAPAEAAAHLATTARQKVIVINGDGRSFAYLGGPAYLYRTRAVAIAHELGHALGRLSDEYEERNLPYPIAAPEPTAPNVTLTLPPTKWAARLTPSIPIPTPETDTYAGQIGAFEGGATYTGRIYRPQLTCQMRETGTTPFCIVCHDVLDAAITLEAGPGVVTPPPTQESRLRLSLPPTVTGPIDQEIPVPITVTVVIPVAGDYDMQVTALLSNDLSVTKLTRLIVTIPPTLVGPPQPLAVTGWTDDVIYEEGGIANSFDLDYAAWFATGTGGHRDGLPNGPWSSAIENPVTGGHTVFLLQPASQKNCLRVTGGATGLLTLETPKVLRVLSLLAASGHGGGIATVTLRFQDGSTMDASYRAQDWNGAATTPTFQALGERARNRNLGVMTRFIYEKPVPFALYETAIKVDPGRGPVVSLLFRGASPSCATGIFAVSGA